MVRKIVEELVQIDGSYGEGGGSIVRFSMAFAALLKKPLEIINIRSNRENPGLRTQHLAGIKLIHQIFGGTLQGAEIGSTKIKYFPKQNFSFEANHIKVPIETAASIGLIIQSIQLELANLQEELTIELIGGATYGMWAPSIDFIEHVTLRYLNLFGINFQIKIEKHGFYPKGGAKVILVINPIKSIKNDLVINKRESISQMKGVSIASKQLEKSQVAERTAKSAQTLLEKNGFTTEIESLYVDSISVGNGITVWTESNFPFGSSNVGQRGVSSEKLGQNLATNFLNDWNNGGVLDEYLTDQIIPFMSLHKSEVLTGPLSQHSATNIWLCNKFLPNSIFEIQNLGKNRFSVKTLLD